MVRTSTIAMAMKISPSMMAASVTWCAMHQVTSAAVNQWAEPQEKAARTPMMTIHKVAYGAGTKIASAPKA